MKLFTYVGFRVDRRDDDRGPSKEGVFIDLT